MTTLLSIPLKDIAPSPLNPRRSIPKGQLQELAASISEKGVLQPVLVRTGNKGTKWELIAGHRRLAAALLAKIETIPAIVRQLDDQAVLEIQVIENLQRSDLHPLEEAAGYQQLMRIAKYDAAQVAAKIGRSVKYVYDRVKLLQLTKEAKALFLEDKITAGHAILLARLSAKDQARALAHGNAGIGGVFTAEQLLWNPDNTAESDDEKALKPNSVRELQAWIDQHVRFDATKVDPMLFPDTAQLLGEESFRKVVPITHTHYISEEAREGRTFGPRSWKRADGELKSKTCEHSVTGFVAVGPARGDAFLVCVAKEKCRVHWPAPAKKKATAAGAGNAQDRANSAARAQEANRRAEEKKKRWIKARPAIMAAIGEKLKATAAGSQGPLAEMLIRYCHGYGQVKSDAVPRGRTAEDLVRHLVFLRVCSEVAHDWNIDVDLPRLAKRFGVDAGKILNQVAPVEKSAAEPRSSVLQ